MPEDSGEKKESRKASPVEAAAQALPEGFWYHPEGYLWLVLPLERFSELPESVETGGVVYLRKSEFHVTVINARGTARRLSGGDAAAAERIEARILVALQEYAKQHTVAFGEFIGDLRLASSAERESIAARCTLVGVEDFFASLSAEFGAQLPVQPPHVSIYSREQDKAVGIDSDEEMEAFPRLDLPEVDAALGAR